jgi:small subunit ribosomal protein S16
MGAGNFRDFDPLKEAGLPEQAGTVLTWLRQGAQPTVTVKTLLRRSGLWKQFETGGRRLRHDDLA